MSLYKKFAVARKVRESRSVVSLYLQPADDSPLEEFKPGQHLLFKFNVPGQEIPTFRYYSFSDSYNGQYYRISVKKECMEIDGQSVNGLCSSYISDVVKEGDLIEAKSPSGDFYIRPEAPEPLALIAGGIGITPLLSMLKSIALLNPKRLVYFFYGVNERADHSFFEELDAIKKQQTNIHFFIFYNKIDSEDIRGVHYDFEGYVTIEKIFEQLSDFYCEYYICGPAGMMKYITSELEKSGVPGEKIHTESFSLDINQDEVEILQPARKQIEEGDEIMIEFRRSGKKLVWDKRYRSILEFAEAHDVEISSGCLFGDCGTCLTRIETGEINYIHPTMVQPDKGKCLPCSCVPAGDLVLHA